MNDVAQAQMRQLLALRTEIQALRSQVNTWATATAFLAKAMQNAEPTPITPKGVAIPKEVFRDLPQAVKVELIPVQIRAEAEEGEEEPLEEEMVVVCVTPRTDRNGFVPVSRAGLVLP